ncbi:transglycosylase domain-containing protein [Mesobacillus zeae]
MNKVHILSVLTVLLAFLSFFHIYEKGTDISELKDDLAKPTVIYDHEKKVVSKISANKNEGLGINEIPDQVKNAVIAIEDHRFYQHGGLTILAFPELL